MSFLSLVVRSLVYHWRIHVAVGAAVAAATAVLTGALLVGDSVRGSLWALTMDRLGAIDQVLLTDRFFRAEMASELETTDVFQSDYDRVVPAILFPSATVEQQGGGASARAAGVLVVGAGPGFWELDRADVRPQQLPGKDEIVLNAVVAEEMGVSVGDEIVLRLPKGNQVPADSPLAQKGDRIRSVAGLKVVDIVPARGLGRFNLRASQQLSRDVFVSIETLQDALEQPNRVNAVLVAGKGTEPPDEPTTLRLQQALRPTLEDLGLSIRRVTRKFQDQVIYDYFSITTDRMILSPATEAVLEEALAGLPAEGVLTYLANRLSKQPPAELDDPAAGVPYSTVTAIDPSDAFPLTDRDGQRLESLGNDGIVLNSWTADELGAAVGDQIWLQYFAPETTHGDAVEQTESFVVRAIAPLTEPEEPYRRRRPAEYDMAPTLVNDPSLTPEVEGVTDQESIDDWDPPFPFDYARVTGADEAYWDNHRTTPKAFLSLQAGQRLWGSRFGHLTAYRIAADGGIDEAGLRSRILEAYARSEDKLDLTFIPVKAQQLKASSGTTPFDALFLALSFFIIAAALLLVFLLFRLGVEQRAAQVGILLAVGISRRQASRVLVAEGALVSLDGAIAGVFIGSLYAQLMLYGLRTWWVGAITTPFLEYHWSWLSILGGYFSGVLISVLTILWSVYRLRSVPVRKLLSGQAADTGSFVTRPSRLLSWLTVLLFFAAVGASVVAPFLVGIWQAVAFFAAGAALLSSALLYVWQRLRQGRRARPLIAPWALSKLAWRNAARNPGRSAITIALMATASFLIISMSSFRLAPTEAGTAGFDLLAESAEPIFADLNTADGRAEVLVDRADLLDGGEMYNARLRPGDDASCNNLYQTQQPRVLGVTPAWIERFDDPDVAHFRWFASASETPQEAANPWRLLLDAPTDAEKPIPAVIDMNTAMYSLKVGMGAEYTAQYDGREVTFKVVGLLENSVLQGSILVSEAAFERAFPEVSGYRYFLIRSPPGKREEVRRVLEERLGDSGFDAVPADRVLSQLLAVQNTYLSTFQSLGALGLLLGTFGLATVQLRNIVERRGELALLRAAGFRRRRLSRMVLLENVALLLAGLGIGVLAALLAVLPHKLGGEAAFSLSLLRDLLIMLSLVLLVGVISSVLTARTILRTPLLPALRGE